MFGAPKAVVNVVAVEVTTVVAIVFLALLRIAVVDVGIASRSLEELDETATDRDKVKPLSFEMYRKLIEQLGKRSRDAILPVQIAYFTGLRLGEVAGLTWQDINLEEQYLTVRRSVRYNGATHKHEIGPTKWKRSELLTLAIPSQTF